MHSFHGYTPPEDVLAATRRGEIRAFCLFTHANVSSPAQVRALTDALYRAAQEGGQPPPLIGIDQEGGQLMAIAGEATDIPGNMALGATHSPELAEQAGRVLGRELLAMGINLNFAPVLDVNINPENPVVGTRSFGDDPALVAELGVAMIRGMRAEGILTAVKHFPGHGDTDTDTHHTSPTIVHSVERMETVELRPFQAAIEAGTDAVMTAHVIFSALDAERPATISPAVLSGLLRRDMGFTGLIITDAMDMYAVARYGAEESVRAALAAGADLALLGHLTDQLALSRRLNNLKRPDSAARIRAAQDRIPRDRPSLEIVGCPEHRRVARQIAERAITLVRGGERLPLRPGPEDMIAVITAQSVDLTPADTSSAVRIALDEAIRRRHPRTTSLEMPRQAPEQTVAAVLHAAAAADIVIVATTAADSDPGQAALVRELHARGKSPVVIALRTPYDLRAFPMIEVYLCAYSVRPVSTEAAARVLFGEIPATGLLPCAIPGYNTPTAHPPPAYG